MARCRLRVPTRATRRSETSCTVRLEGEFMRAKSRLGVQFALVRNLKILDRKRMGDAKTGPNVGERS